MDSIFADEDLIDDTKVAIVSRFEAPSDYDQKHDLQIRLLDPDGAVISDEEAVLDWNIRNSNIATVIATLADVELRYGRYSVEIIVDESVIETITFRIRQPRS